MSEEEKNAAASDLARKRWEKTSAKKRSQVGSELAAARWKGHVAKRPASSRKKAAKKAGANKKLS
jgi:hypothetical protein